LPGVEEFDAGADEVPGVARRQRGGVRATDRGDLCVEGVDGASATLSCRCDVAVQSCGGSVEGEDLVGGGSEHLVGELPQLGGTPPREPRETEADLGPVIAVVEGIPLLAGAARSRPPGLVRGA
jgi:hypothetical protein